MFQSSSLDFKLVQRVCLLQQALDQAMASIEEMRGEVKDKQWIETQLANTEKYANTQQQAIAQLKHNLAQFTDTQQQLIEMMSHRLHALIDHQQGEFNRLRLQLQKGEIEVQTYLQYVGTHCSSGKPRQITPEEDYLALKSEIMVARSMAVSLSSHLNLTRQHLGNLTSALDNHHLNLEHIMQAVQAVVHSLEVLDTPQCLPPELPPETSLEGQKHPSSADHNILQNAVHQQAQYIQELEKMLLEQYIQQTHLSQRCQSLAAQRDHYKHQLENRKALPLFPTASTEVPTLDSEDNTAPLEQSPQTNLRSQSTPIQPLRLEED